MASQSNKTSQQVWGKAVTLSLKTQFYLVGALAVIIFLYCSYDATSTSATVIDRYVREGRETDIKLAYSEANVTQLSKTVTGLTKELDKLRIKNERLEAMQRDFGRTKEELAVLRNDKEHLQERLTSLQTDFKATKRNSDEMISALQKFIEPNPTQNGEQVATSKDTGTQIFGIEQWKGFLRVAMEGFASVQTLVSQTTDAEKTKKVMHDELMQQVKDTLKGVTHTCKCIQKCDPSQDTNQANNTTKDGILSKAGDILSKISSAMWWVFSCLCSLAFWVFKIILLVLWAIWKWIWQGTDDASTKKEDSGATPPNPNPAGNVPTAREAWRRAATDSLARIRNAN